jgi:hypothetical protein
MDDLTSSLHSLEQQHLASSFQWGIFPSTWHDMLLIVRKVILSISQNTHYGSLFAWAVFCLCKGMVEKVQSKPVAYRLRAQF